MRYTIQHIRVLLTLLFAVAAYVFFGFYYPHHLHYQEQFQLFLFTSTFAGEVIHVPGGLADYLGRFLTQFFFYAQPGAMLLALLLTGIQWLTWLLNPSRTSASGNALYPLSFLPALVLWLFLCDENAMPSSLVAMLLAQSAAVATNAIRSNRCRRIVFLLSIPALYFLLGSFSCLYIPVVLTHEWVRHRPSTGIFLTGCAVAALAAVACPIVASHLSPYPLVHLFSGIHYHRFPLSTPTLGWLATLAAALLPIIGCFASLPVCRQHGKPIGITLFVLLTGIFAMQLNQHADFLKEETMGYDYMARMKMWNRIMITADRQSPTTPLGVTCLNLALSQSGRMADHLFDYYQNGTEGLLPTFRRDFMGPLAASEVYYHLGMTNTAQRYTFEAQEAIPDFQKSARCYKRLAETNLINGHYEVARKYLKALTHTLFYRAWAQQMLPLLGNETAIRNHPEYGPLKKAQYTEDFLFSDAEMDAMLGRLFQQQQPHRRTTFEYLMAGCLLRKDLKHFHQYYPMGQSLDYKQIPRSYQEALLLIWTQQHNDFQGMPWSIDPAIARRMTQFINDYTAQKPAAYMKAQYAGTYWTYYFF